MTNNIIDQLLFLQDVLNIQVPCVNDYLKDVLVKEFFIRYCYEVIQPDSKNMVEVNEKSEKQPLIQLRTSLFLLSSVLNAMKEISFHSKMHPFIHWKLPSHHPDLQKDLLSLFFPENDHPNEMYHPDRQDSTQTISRRMSVYLAIHRSDA